MRSESAIQASEKIKKYAEEQLSIGRARYKCTIDHYNTIIDNLKAAINCLTEVKKMSGFSDDEPDHSDTGPQTLSDLMKIISAATQSVGQSQIEIPKSSSVTGIKSKVSSKPSERGSRSASGITQINTASPTASNTREWSDWKKARTVYYEAMRKIDGIRESDCKYEETLLCSQYIVRWYNAVYDAVDRTRGKGRIAGSIGLGPDKIREIIPRLVISVCYHAKQKYSSKDSLDDFENMFQNWISLMYDPDSKKYPYPKPIKDMMVKTPDKSVEYVHPKYFEVDSYNADKVYEELLTLGLSHASTDVQGRGHTEYLSSDEVDRLEIESSNCSSENPIDDSDSANCTA